jgi:class 3 adenylate cyclase/predicted ATPase
MSAPQPEPSSAPQAGTPPTGVVTFLFTDIVGSTDMWERHGDAFLPVLQTHDAVLRSTVAKHSGYVVKTEGDSFKVAFANAADAINCAVEAQAALQRYPWPDDIGAVEVRMGIHSGHPFHQTGDYFGPTVNRASRIAGAAHGGQILVSEDAAAMAEACLDAHAVFADMGHHRLKDLGFAVRLFSVSHPDLDARSHLPPRTLNGRPNNLPVQRTTFVGREREVAQLARMLGEAGGRLTAVTGPEGVGKTRLILQAAAERIDWFPDGVWLVRLSDLPDAEAAARAVAAEVGIDLSGHPTAVDAVREHLARRECLLILDDCGNAPEAGRLLRELLSGAPSLRCVVTSRRSLDVSEAAEVEVPPLSLPEESPTAREVMESEAGRLFVERVSEVRPDFRLTEQRAKPTGRLTRLLGGLPGALEKAAEMFRGPDGQAGVGLADLGREVAQAAEMLTRATVSKSQELVDRLNTSPTMASFLQNLSAALTDAHALEEAEEACRQAMEMHRANGNPVGVATSMRRLGLIAMARKQFERAEALLAAARDSLQALGSPEALEVEAEIAAVRRAAARRAGLEPAVQGVAPDAA